MQKLRIYFYLFIFCIIMPQFTVNRKSIKLHNMLCLAIDKDFAVFDKCSMKAVSRNITEVNVHIQLKQKPLTNIYVYVDLRRRGKMNIPPVFQFMVDGCAFMRNKRRNPLAQLVYEAFGLEKYSNMNHTCPIDHDLIVKNWRFDYKTLNNLPLPNGEYNILTSLIAFNKTRTNSTISFKLYDS